MSTHTKTNGQPLTFFTGETSDGHSFVLTWEGGGTPGSRCLVTGRVPMVHLRTGHVRSVPVSCSTAAASHLRAMLPHLTASEVREEYSYACAQN